MLAGEGCHFLVNPVQHMGIATPLPDDAALAALAAPITTVVVLPRQRMWCANIVAEKNII